MADASDAFTSAGAGLLLQEHRLKLDDVIQMYVPAFPEKPWPVTLRELMAHTSGVRDDRGDEEPLQERCEQTVDGLRRFADRPLLFEPGTKYRRSSYGWILVSAAIEAAAGQPFFRFMRTHVFEPAGMTATREDAAGESIPDRATFYYPRFAGDTRYGPEPARDGAPPSMRCRRLNISRPASRRITVSAGKWRRFRWPASPRAWRATTPGAISSAGPRR